MSFFLEEGQLAAVRRMARLDNLVAMLEDLMEQEHYTYDQAADEMIALLDHALEMVAVNLEDTK